MVYSFPLHEKKVKSMPSFLLLESFQHLFMAMPQHFVPVLDDVCVSGTM